MNEQDQECIARWMGWKQDGELPPIWWAAPGDEGGVPTRRLPDLTTFEGVAVWCTLIGAELSRLNLWTMIDLWPGGAWTAQIQVCDANDDAGGDGAVRGAGETKLAALTAAVLAIMESEK